MIDAYITTVPRRLAMAMLLKQKLKIAGVCDAKISLDRNKEGAWQNTSWCLEKSLGKGRHVAIFQDDMVVNDWEHYKTVFDNCLKNMEKHNFGLISLASPHRKYEKERERGENALVGYDFMNAVNHIVHKNFVGIVLAEDKNLDQKIVEYHVEVRYKYASQVHEIQMCMLIGGPADHDVSVPSELGHPKKVFGIERKAVYLSTEDFGTLNYKTKHTKRDLWKAR